MALLRGNALARVHATDPAPSAVEQARCAAEAAGFAHRMSAEVQPTPTEPSTATYGPFDLAMILFTLSAIPGDTDGRLLASTTARLRPGGAVLVRDYGLYDMKHLHDARASKPLEGQHAPSYLRPGGMCRRYYSTEAISALAAAAGLQVEESRYLCVRLRNVKRNLTMDRVYVHAVLRKPGPAS